MHLKMLSAKCQPLCSGHNMLLLGVLNLGEIFTGRWASNFWALLVHAQMQPDICRSCITKHVNPHETARYGEVASAILKFFVCCMEMG